MSQNNEDEAIHLESGQIPYRKIREIGAGSFGIAYEVEHVEEGTRWVAKEINLENLPVFPAILILLITKSQINFRYIRFYYISGIFRVFCFFLNLKHFKWS